MISQVFKFNQQLLQVQKTHSKYEIKNKLRAIIRKSLHNWQNVGITVIWETAVILLASKKYILSL